MQRNERRKSQEGRKERRRKKVWIEKVDVKELNNKKRV